MIAELRFRKMKEIVMIAVDGKPAYWNRSETPLGEAHHVRSKDAAAVRYKFWKNPRFQRAIATVPDTLEIECPIDGVDTVPLVVLPHRKGPAWIQMTSASMAWLTSVVAAQFADGRVVPKNQPRKIRKLADTGESTTGSERDFRDSFANESDQDTDADIDAPEPSMMIEPTPMPQRVQANASTRQVVSDIAAIASVQTQLGRFFTAAQS